MNNAQPIRILCVFSTLDRGGAESMCMNLYRHIDRSKVQFDFVKHTQSKGAFEDEITLLGGRIYEAPRFRLKNIYKYCAWWKTHFDRHPEHMIIHGHYFTISAIYFDIAKSCGRITIAHSHIAQFDNSLKQILCKGIESKADYCLACGMDAGKLLFPKRHFIVLNNAIEAQKFRYNAQIRAKYREELGVEDDKVIGIVANFGDHKNPLGVVELFKRLADKNSNYKLIWVGNGGTLMEKVKEKIAEYGLQDRVSLLGARSDVPALMQAMDAFILPSFYEGLPVVLIEAQAAGLRCFASDKVTTEADITGRCTYLPLDNWGKWVDEIEESDLSHIDTYRSIVKSNYDIAYTSAKLQEFYEILAQNTSKYHNGGGQAATKC